jgi:hypothetical protein
MVAVRGVLSTCVRQRQERTCLKRITNRRQSEFVIQLTAQERDLLVAPVQAPGALDGILGPGPRNGPIVSLYLAREEASEFCWLVEQTANFAQNEIAQRRLAHLLARLEDGFADTVDPGAHLVRPGGCCLGYSAKQGQYPVLFAFCFGLSRSRRLGTRGNNPRRSLTRACSRQAGSARGPVWAVPSGDAAEEA